MDRDEFIITVYCLVCDQYRVIKNTYPVRRNGVAPALSDEKVEQTLLISTSAAKVREVQQYLS